MSTIVISDLCPVGSALFSDNESYLRELTQNEIIEIQGGHTATLISLAAVSVISYYYYYTPRQQ